MNAIMIKKSVKCVQSALELIKVVWKMDKTLFIYKIKNSSKYKKLKAKMIGLLNSRKRKSQCSNKLR